jgi:serine/threonine-protein kinase
MDPTVGVTLGKYQLVATIGRGGMADVFLALARGDMGFTKLVVLKCMRVTDQEKQFTSMFFDEVRLAARLSHPNIVTTFDGGDVDGTYFLAMEFLEGQALDQVWRAWSGPEQPDARVWALVMAEVLAGLGYAHALKDFDGSPLRVVHRDVSPQNIFLTYDGTVKLMDFGIAKAASNVNLTEAGTLKGKIRYMSPEQFGGRPIDHRSDLFSAGVVLWELLAGQRLLQGEVGVVMQRLLAPEPLPRLSEVLADVPPRLDALVARALEKDPARRFQRASEMRAELLTFVREAGGLDPGDLGRALLQTFSESRERVRSQVEAHVLRAGNAHSVRELGSVRLGAGLDTPSSGTLRPIQGGPLGSEATQMARGQTATPATTSAELFLGDTGLSGPSQAPPAGTSPEPARPAGAPAALTPSPAPAEAPRKRSALPVVLGVAALAAVAVAVVTLRPGASSEPPPAPIGPTAQPAVKLAPAPGGALPQEPQAARASGEAPPGVAPPPGQEAPPGEGRATAAPGPAPERGPGPAEVRSGRAAPASEELAKSPARTAPATPPARQPAARAAAGPSPAAPTPGRPPSPAPSTEARVAASPAGPVPDRPGSGARLSEPTAPLASPVVVAAASPPPPPPAAAEVRPAEAAPTPAPQKAQAPPPPVAGLGKSAVDRVFKTNYERIQDCLDHATLDGRPIQGKVKLTIDLEGGGKVSRIGETSTILERGAPLEQCIVETVKQWRFPPTGDGEPTQVVYTLTFRNGT